MPPGPAIHGSPAQGYFIQPRQGAAQAAPQHAFGSPENGPVACPMCGESLVRALRLDTADARLELPDDSPFLDLWLCATCSMTRYAVSSRGECLPARSPDAIQANSPFRTPPPGPVSLHAIPERIQEARTLARERRLDEAGSWARRFDWHRPIHQVGGEPIPFDSLSAQPACDRCGGEMSYLASVVASEAPECEPLDQPTTQAIFFNCRPCRAILAQRDSVRID